MSGWFMGEYLCPACGRVESLERRPPPPAIACPSCGKRSTACVSAVASKTCWASAGTQGKPEPPPRPTATNFIPLGEGQKKSEWQAQRKKVWRDHDHARRRAKGAPI